MGELHIMRITAQLSVAGAAAIFGVVIAAGGAFAASGSTMIADSPGQVLQVLGVGAPTAGQSAAIARLKLQAAAGSHGQVEEVVRAEARAVNGSTDAGDNGSRSDATTRQHRNGFGSAALDARSDHPTPAIPAIPATPAIPASPDASNVPGTPATPATPSTPAIRGPFGNQ